MTGLLTIDGSGIHPDLGDDFALQSAAPQDFPSGYTTFRDQQGDFPAGTTGIVETHNLAGAANARQLNWNHDQNILYMRMSTGTDWTAWTTIAPRWSCKQFLNDTNHQTIPNETKTKVQLGGVSYDHGGLSDEPNNQMVLSPGGIWLVTGLLRWSQSAGGSRRVEIEVAGSLGHTAAIDDSGGVEPRMQIATVLQADDGDTLEMFAYQDSGGDMQLADGSVFTNLSATFVGRIA